jgi:hypothetical protein
MSPTCPPIKGQPSRQVTRRLTNAAHMYWPSTDISRAPGHYMAEQLEHRYCLASLKARPLLVARIRCPGIRHLVRYPVQSNDMHGRLGQVVCQVRRLSLHSCRHKTVTHVRPAAAAYLGLAAASGVIVRGFRLRQWHVAPGLTLPEVAVVELAQRAGLAADAWVRSIDSCHGGAATAAPVSRHLYWQRHRVGAGHWMRIIGSTEEGCRAATRSE